MMVCVQLSIEKNDKLLDDVGLLTGLFDAGKTFIGALHAENRCVSRPDKQASHGKACMVNVSAFLE